VPVVQREREEEEHLMPGPAPKDAASRVRRAAPSRGEWFELPPASGEVPELPDGWSDRTRTAWEAWWNDPASTQWTPADRESLTELAELVEMAATNPSPTLYGEIRHRLDGLGLTQKGKRDLRWRVADVEPPKPAPTRRPKRSRHLKPVL
jgi:hypothetical protein